MALPEIPRAEFQPGDYVRDYRTGDEYVVTSVVYDKYQGAFSYGILWDNGDYGTAWESDLDLAEEPEYVYRVPYAATRGRGFNPIYPTAATAKGVATQKRVRAQRARIVEWEDI